MSSGSIVAVPVVGTVIVSGVTPTSFICSMDLFTWLPILRVRPEYSAISSMVVINALALVLGLTISYTFPFIASYRPLNVVVLVSLLMLLLFKEPGLQPALLLVPSWLRPQYPPRPPRPWPPLVVVTSPVNPEIPDAPAVEDPLLAGGGVAAVPDMV